MQKTIGEFLDPQRLVILVLKSLLWVQKPQMRMVPIETSKSDANVAVVNAQNHRRWLGPLETSNSGAKVAV